MESAEDKGQVKSSGTRGVFDLAVTGVWAEMEMESPWGLRISSFGRTLLFRLRATEAQQERQRDENAGCTFYSSQ